MDENIIYIIGIAGAACTSLSFLPQIIKGLKTKKMNDVSKTMPIILIIGVVLWMIYGFYKNDLVIIGANAVSLALLLILGILLIKYSD